MIWRVQWPYHLYLSFFSDNDHHVKTMTIQVDFSGGHEIYQPIAKALEGFEIGVIGEEMCYTYFLERECPLITLEVWKSNLLSVLNCH